jgi:hypothetical protein
VHRLTLLCLLDSEPSAVANAEIGRYGYAPKSNQQLGQPSASSPCKCSTSDQAAAESSQSQTLAGKRGVLENCDQLQLHLRHTLGDVAAAHAADVLLAMLLLEHAQLQAAMYSVHSYENC